MFLISCAPPIKQDFQYVEADFQIYLDEFEAATGVRYQGDIMFTATGSLEFYVKDAIAICAEYKDGGKIIRVDTGFWLTADNESREQLIFHELGHCALGRKHKDNKMLLNVEEIQYYVPQSIMYPRSFGGWMYRELKQYYLKELADEQNELTEMTL